MADFMNGEPSVLIHQHVCRRAKRGGPHSSDSSALHFGDIRSVRWLRQAIIQQWRR